MSHHYSSKKKKSTFFDISELLSYKDLFIILAYRDLRVRYAQTFLGLLWAIIQPVSTLVIFTLVFGKVVNVDSGGVPYPLFAVSGLVAWSYFAFVLSQSGNSVIGAQDMIKKIYFPRLIIPLSKSLVGLVDFLVAIIFLVVLLAYFRFVPSTGILFLPVLTLLIVLSALAVGIWLSALTIRYRDFQHVVPFLVQFGLYATPVGYPTSLVLDNLPEWAAVLYCLNPMVGIIESIRWSVFGMELSNDYFILSISGTLILLLSGLWYFKRVEKVMADLV